MPDEHRAINIDMADECIAKPLDGACVGVREDTEVIRDEPCARVHAGDRQRPP